MSAELGLENLKFADPLSRDWIRTHAPLAEMCERWEVFGPEQRIDLLGLLRLLPPIANATEIFDHSLAVKRDTGEKAMAIRLLGVWGRTSSFHSDYLRAVRLQSQEMLLRYTLEELGFNRALVKNADPLADILSRCKDSPSTRFALWTLVVKITENAECLRNRDDVQWFSHIMKISTKSTKGSGPSQLTPSDLFSARWATSHLGCGDPESVLLAANAIRHGLCGSPHTGREEIGAFPAVLPLMDATSASEEVARALATAESWTPESYR